MELSVCVLVQSQFSTITFRHNNVKQPQKLTTEVLHLNDWDIKTDLMRLMLSVLISITIRISLVYYLQDMYICSILYYCQCHYQHAAVAHKRADNYNFACSSCSVNTQCVPTRCGSHMCRVRVRHLSQLATGNCGSSDFWPWNVSAPLCHPDMESQNCSLVMWKSVFVSICR